MLVQGKEVKNLRKQHTKELKMALSQQMVDF